MIKRLRARVVGKVQMVNFRDFVEKIARKYKLTGFVRNDIDDSVEVVVEGEEEYLRELERKLMKGPVLSNVETVVATYEESKNEFRGFSIRS